MMTGWGSGGYGWMGFFLALFFLILIVVGIVLAVRAGRGGGEDRVVTPSHPAERVPDAPPRSSALAVLEERYALGEIDRDEFSARKRDLTE